MSKKVSRTRSETTRNQLNFPRCSCCGQDMVPLASCAAILVQVGDDPPQLIPESENAGLLRFLPTFASDEAVIMQHMSKALGGSHEIDRILHTLRNKRKIPILCDRVPKATEPGFYGHFYLGPNVTLSEPGEGGE